ncbi:MAG: PH domain-containing protein [Kangiellaceae bacterium]|nr:PH domain-containing protein [Kangiellaceae bacterium]
MTNLDNENIVETSTDQLRDTETALEFNASEWQRLSPFSVIFFIGRFITHLVKDALPSLAPLAIVIFNSDNKAWITTLILIGFVGLMLVNSFLQFWYFKFKVDGQKVLVNDGVFKKNHRIIQFDRIQNINILQPIYFKPFSLVNLQIETAGAKGNEANLAGISTAFANYLRVHVMQQKQQSASSNIESQALEQENDVILAKASMRDLVHYGMSSNGIFWFFVLIAPLFSLTDDILEKWVTKEDFAQMAEFFGGGMAGNIILAVSAILLTMALMFSFSIIGAILRYFKYQLSLIKTHNGKPIGFSHQTLKRSSGLLTSYQESLKLQKVQTFISQSNFIGRWLRVENITLGQVSNHQNAAKNRSSLFVIPARTSEQSAQLKDKLLEDFPDDIETSGIDRRYIYKTLSMKIFFPALFISIPMYLVSEFWFVFLIPFVASLVLLPLVIRRWRAYRFGMKNGYAKFERGFFGFRHILFPLFKVQRVEVKQSPIQRRRNLATIKLYLASNRVQMQYIPMDVALKWMSIINRHIESTNKPWY